MKKKPAKQYAPRPLQWVNILLRYSLGFFLRFYFRISTSGLEAIQGLESFVLIPTHHGNWDPFIIGSHIKKPVHWVTSDGNMRSRFMRFFLQYVGSIPKSKNIPDIQTIGWIVDTIRKKKGIVGLFVEGQASWDGHTQKIMDGTGKLLKFLKAPVVLAIFEGAYYSQPRWGRGLRRGKLHIRFEILFQAEDLKELPHENIQEKLSDAMCYDEAAWQEETKQKFSSPFRSEYLERALYLCPSCKSIASLESKKNKFLCTICHSAFLLNASYKIEEEPRKESLALDIQTIRQWNLWQKETYPHVLHAIIEKEKGQVLFIDEKTRIYRGRRMNPLVLLQRGKLVLYADRIEHEGKKRTLTFYFKDIDAEGVLKGQLLEFYEGKNLYQVRFASKRQSARKWADAVTALR